LFLEEFEFEFEVVEKGGGRGRTGESGGRGGDDCGGSGRGDNSVG
jgi:hypothetical protein